MPPHRVPACEHVDLALGIGALPDNRLIAARLGTVRLVTCASPANFAERGTPEKPSDLAQHDCVTFAGLMLSGAWNFRSGKSELTVPIRSRLSVNTAEAAIDAAIAASHRSRPNSHPSGVIPLDASSYMSWAAPMLKPLTSPPFSSQVRSFQNRISRHA